MTLYPETRYLHLSHPYIPISEQFPFRIGMPVLREHVPAYRHDFLELSLIVEGEGYQVVNGKHIALAPGTFFFLLPYQVHEIYLETPQLTLYNCIFDMNVLFWSSSLVNGLEQLLLVHEELPSHVHLRSAERQTFQRVMADMLLEFRSESIWKHQLLQVKLMELLIRFDRIRRPLALHEEAPVSIQPIWSVVRHVHQHYDKTLDMAALAEQYGMSSAALRDGFKQLMGVPFLSFVQHIRVRHACGLLASTELRLSDIMGVCGFGSMRSFSRTFQAIKGMTPTDYRSMHRLQRASRGREMTTETK